MRFDRIFFSLILIVVTKFQNGDFEANITAKGDDKYNITSLQVKYNDTLYSDEYNDTLLYDGYNYTSDYDGYNDTLQYERYNNTFLYNEPNNTLDYVGHSGVSGDGEHYTDAVGDEWESYYVYYRERALHEELFSKYNKDVIPRLQENGYTEVNFFFSLLKLASFDIKEQVLTVVGIVTMNWFDDQLNWMDKDRFTFLDTISVDRSNIWTPDIVLYNSADISGKSPLEMYTTRPIVYYAGYVDWNSPVRLRVSCSSDITWFPVDRQVCQMIFGSWSYNRDILRIFTFRKTAMSFQSKVFQVESGEWKIESVSIKMRNITFDCCHRPFSAMVFQIKLKRMSLFYFLYIILPLIALAFLFLFVFHIPFDSGERTGFGVTVLLSITVYLLVISEKLPEKSDGLPILGICFVFIFFLLCAALLLAIFTMHSPSFTSQPPRLLIAFLNFRLQNIVLFLKYCKKKSAVLPRHSKENEKEIDIEEGQRDNIGCHENDEFGEQWKLISRKMEKCLFIMFGILLLLVPSIVVICLRKDE